MNLKKGLFAVSGLILALIFCGQCSALNTWDIDEVRDEPVLDQDDFAVIDKFILRAVSELVGTDDLSAISKKRMVISSRRESSQPNQAQYATQFIESAYRHIGGQLKSSQIPQDRRGVVTVNLLILIDSLENLRTADLAFGKLNDPSAVVKYWAVRCLTGSWIIEKLKSSSDEDIEFAKKAVREISKVVGGSDALTLNMIAQFAAGLNLPQAEELLMKVCDKRISDYSDWSVQDEFTDAVLLRFLCERSISSKQNGPQLGRKFCQLFSFVIQRYIKGHEILSKDQKSQLASVIVNTEKKCLWKVLAPQTRLKKAIERDNFEIMQLEHGRLLGSPTEKGKLPVKFNFNYSSGRPGPDELREAPKMAD